MAVVFTKTLNNNFRVQANDDGTFTLQEFRAASWQTPTGGPYTSARMLQFWQDLAEIGFAK